MAKRKTETSRAPSQRQLRVAEVLRRELSDVLMRGDVHDPELDGVSITVGEVRTSPDLRQAWVYVLPLGGQDADRIVEALERVKGEIRHIVTKKMHLKYSPDLKFITDTSFDRMDETRRLFESDEVQRDLAAGDEPAVE